MRYLREIRRRGLLDSVRYLSRFGSFPVGNLVGKDEYGNQYFESKEALYGKDRWVDYASSDYDASQVPPDWHAWLHHITDEVPKEKLVCLFLSSTTLIHAVEPQIPQAP
jgi:NADH dehydrogenase (ubiquinone) 1 alpha subcomplex subunit 12